MSSTRTIKLTIAYDGTDYVGWQVQPNGSSVQAAVERAIGKLTGEQLRIMAAGRTDSGVHAVGQVAAFRTNSTIPADRFRQGLQTFLPDDILIRASDEVHDLFHATYWAKRKHYRYVICNANLMGPFVRRYCHQFHGELNLDQMNQAAQYLPGTHDFRCFESHFPNKATSVRTIESALLTRQHSWTAWDADDVRSENIAGDFIWFDVEADGFLYNMVRTIVGTLIKIGRGFWPPEVMQQIIEQQDRSRAGETAPPQGLYLVRVDYRSEPDANDVANDVANAEGLNAPDGADE
jgi:tRNA pseudouridine38-40 synthase